MPVDHLSAVVGKKKVAAQKGHFHLATDQAMRIGERKKCRRFYDRSE